MKPLYLSIKGFGPYLQAEIKEEDFKFLTQNRLFLISGEIGAGKTTLFDAIFYALYGESTIEGRNPTSLISHFIKNKPNLIPEIKFKFFLDGKIYQIVRRPSFRGRAENVSLWIENKLFSAKKNEIKDKIKELIGLDAKQFKKVFLIPQGEYRKILIAKGEEREALLETIFETFIFSQLEDFLKNKIKEIKELYQSLNKREEDLKKISQVSDLNELKNKIEKLENQQKDLEKKLKILNSKKENIEIEIKKIENILQLYQEISVLSQKLETFKEKEKEIQIKKGTLKKLKILKDNLIFYENFKKFQKELREIHLEKKKLLNRYLDIKKELENLETNIEHLEQYKKEIENKKQELQKLKEIEIYFKEKKELEKKLNQIISQLKNKIKNFENLQNKIKNLKNDIEKTFEEKDKFNKAIFLFKEKERIGNLLKNFEENERLIIESKKVEKNISELIRRCEDLERIKRDLEIKNHAEYLVRFLKKGEPCPVCGSCHHPNPIKAENFVEKLEKVEKELLKKKELLEKEKEKYYTLKIKRETIKKDIQNQDKEILHQKYTFIENELSKFPKMYLEKLISGVYENLDDLLENRIKNFKKQLTFLEEKETKEKEEIEKLKNEEISIKERLNIFQNLFKDFSFFEDISFKIKNLENEIKEWEDKKKSLETKVRFFRDEKIKIETKIKNLEDLLNKIFPEYRKNLSKLVSLKKEGFIKSVEDFKNFVPMLSQIEEIEREVQVFFSEFERIQKNLEEAQRSLENFSEKPLNKENLYKELELKKEEKRYIEESLGVLNKEIGSLNREILQLQEILATYEKIKEEKRFLEAEYPLLEALYNLIIGKNKKGVSFHSFVLSIFAQLILKRANFYFREFSFGRYKFIEDEVLQKKFILEVFDHYTGSKRETKTLSGGESFLATLSLALGISDVILYLYRTRPFESLFIDEGFGNLDENTLEKVINILLNLAHYSGRIIGIISHLKDLKEKFPAVIEVYKTQLSGSYLRINKKI